MGNTSTGRGAATRAPGRRGGPANAGMAAGGGADGDETPDARFIRTLFDESAVDLLRYVRRLVPGDPGRAEDIVQETFLRAWRHRDRLAGHGAARAWLFRVARNLAVDALRRSARPGELELLGEDVTWMADPLAEAGLEAVRLRTVLVEAMRSLSVPHREALVHLHYLGRTQAETADLLDVPLGTVKSRHHFAVRELRRALDLRGVTGW